MTRRIKMGCWRSLFNGLFLRNTSLLALPGLFKTFFFFIGLGYQYGDGCRVILIVQSDIDKVGSIRVGPFSGDGILCDHLYFGFHRCSSSVGDLCCEGDEVADLDGFAEDERIHGHGHNARLGVSHAGQGSGFIDQFHDPAAVDISMVVGMFRLH